MTYLPAADRYDTMTYRRTGRSGLKLPPLSLGLWHNFGDDKPLETQRAILCDPQTSGGLLVAVSADAEAQVQALLREQGLSDQPIGQLVNNAQPGALIELVAGL